MKPESPNNFFSELFRIKWSGCFYAEDNIVFLWLPQGLFMFSAQPAGSVISKLLQESKERNCLNVLVAVVKRPASWFSYLKATPGKQGEKLTLNFLVAVVNTTPRPTPVRKWLNSVSKMHQVQSISHCKRRMKIELSLSSVLKRRSVSRTCFTSHLYSLCGMVRYRTLRVKQRTFLNILGRGVCL